MSEKALFFNRFKEWITSDLNKAFKSIDDVIGDIGDPYSYLNKNASSSAINDLSRNIETLSEYRSTAIDNLNRRYNFAVKQGYGDVVKSYYQDAMNQINSYQVDNISLYNTQLTGMRNRYKYNSGTKAINNSYDITAGYETHKTERAINDVWDKRRNQQQRAYDTYNKAYTNTYHSEINSRNGISEINSSFANEEIIKRYEQIKQSNPNMIITSDNFDYELDASKAWEEAKIENERQNYVARREKRAENARQRQQQKEYNQRLEKVRAQQQNIGEDVRRRRAELEEKYGSRRNTTTQTQTQPDVSSQNTRRRTLKNGDRTYRPETVMNGNSIEIDSVYNHSTPRRVNRNNTSSGSNTYDDMMNVIKNDPRIDYYEKNNMVGFSDFGDELEHYSFEGALDANGNIKYLDVSHVLGESVSTYDFMDPKQRQEFFDIYANNHGETAEISESLNRFSQTLDEQQQVKTERYVERQQANVERQRERARQDLERQEQEQQRREQQRQEQARQEEQQRQTQSADNTQTQQTQTQTSQPETTQTQTNNTRQRRDRTNVDPGPIPNTTSGPYVNNTRIDLDPETSVSTMDISDPLNIHQRIVDGNGNTRDITWRRKGRWSDQKELVSDISWNENGVFDNIAQTYTGKDVSPIEWKYAGSWSDDYIIGRAGDDEDLLNSMMNARERKIEAQRRYEERHSRQQQSSNTAENTAQEQTTGPKQFDPDDPTTWTDKDIAEMAQGDPEFYEELLQRRAEATGGNTHNPETTAETMDPPEAETKATPKGPDINDPLSWTDDFIEEVSEGDPTYYQNMIDRRTQAKQDLKQRRKEAYKNYGKNLNADELSKKQKTKLQQPKTNKQKKKSKKQKKKDKKNKQFNDRHNAMGNNPDEQREINKAYNESRRAEKQKEKQQQQAEEQRRQQQQADAEQQQRIDNGDPSQWTDEDIKKMADGDPDVYEDLINQRDKARGVDTSGRTSDFNKEMGNTDAPEFGDSDLDKMIDEGIPETEVHSSVRRGTLSGLDKIMTGVNILGAIGDYKSYRRQGDNVISAGVKTAAKFAIDEALGLWAFPIAIIKNTPGAIIKGADMLYKESRRMNSAANQQTFGDAQFLDTQQLATMRQSGMEMAKMAQYNLQQTLMGSEATYLHR